MDRGKGDNEPVFFAREGGRTDRYRASRARRAEVEGVIAKKKERKKRGEDGAPGNGEVIGKEQAGRKDGFWRSPSLGGYRAGGREGQRTTCGRPSGEGEVF